MFVSIPIGNSLTLKKNYDFIKKKLEKMLYAEQNWTICDHLKVNGLLLGLKRGYIKYAAFSFFGFSRVKSDQWIHDK